MCRPEPSAVFAPLLASPLSAASEGVIEQLIGLTLNALEVSALLDATHGAGSADELRPVAAYRRLARVARDDFAAGARLDGALAGHLAAAAVPFEGRSLVELAAIWHHRRDTIEPRAAAALLWTLAREPSPSFRRLERIVAGEIGLRAARSFSAHRD
ncbi:MAG: hypothetical protein CSA66_07280 [Proteobacteria bacterium]|nr:MAG: hypothetical protein CSA66_07280 [Pseudomonadota bacterium]